MRLLAGAAGMAMVLSCALTWLVRELARRNGWMSGPATRRHIHKSPIPRLGGIAVFIALATPLSAAAGIGQAPNPVLLVGMLLPAAFLLLVGVADDLAGLSAKKKLLAQIVAAVGLFLFGFRLPAPEFLSSYGWLSTTVSLVATSLWAITVINAINLIDGLDGLASGSSLFITAGLLVLGLVASNFETALIGAAAVGAISGFLCFNRTPASIFLGDSGSLVLGCIIAALSTRIISEVATGWIACPIVLAHPFSELVISVARRAVRADHIFCPDRRHLHHRLLDRGLSHAEASVILVAVSFLFSVLGVLAGLGVRLAVIGATTSGVLALGLISSLRYGEFIHLARWLRKAPAHRAVIAANLRLEELSEKLARARSITELRILLSDGFTSMNFQSARLNVRSYDFGSRIGPFSPGTMGLSFPLYADRVRMGTLDLRWDITSGNWPFDPEFFASDFLPALCGKLKTFGVIYRELSHTAPSFSLEDAILPGFVAEQVSSTRLSLEN